MAILKMKNIYIIMGLLFSLLLTFSCKDEDRYDAANNGLNPDNSKTIEKSLMDLIRENPDLKSFTTLLDEVGYSDFLTEADNFTIWAPKDIDLSGLNYASREDTLRFLKNHTARYMCLASGVQEERVVFMENTKLIEFKGSGNDYTFGGIKVDSMNILAKNGVLHILDTQINPKYSVWEKMEATGLDSIRKFLYSHTDSTFDLANSIFVDYVDGIPVYDSVFTTRNSFWLPYYTISYNGLRKNPSLYYKGGFYPINKEDSTYSMLLPTNKAWIEAYGRIFPYFKNNMKNSDDMQHYYTQFAIVQDLVFRGEIAPESAEVLESTRLGVFPEPAYLFDGAKKEEVSNGSVYLTDQLRFKPWESWHKAIQVEGEYITPSYAVVTTNKGKQSVGIKIAREPGVSGYAYAYVSLNSNDDTGAIVAPKTAAYIEYILPNTLAAAYDIKCVFVPDAWNNPTGGAKKTKVAFSFFLHDPDNPDKEIPIIPEGATSNKIVPENDEVSDTEITEMLVAENIKFSNAYIENNDNKLFMKVRIATTLTANRMPTGYANRMSIDYILFEPVQEELN